MPPKKKPAAKEEAPPVNVNDELEQRLGAVKLRHLARYCSQVCDMSVTCVPTGFPQLDKILHPTKLGLVRGRDVEIYSPESHVGKTGLAMALTKAFQQAHLSSGFADIERTVTDELLDMNRIITDPFEDPAIYALRMLRPDEELLTIDELFDAMIHLSKFMDLLTVDSVAALERKANITRDTEDGAVVGGVSKPLSEFFRKNVKKRATILWINQVRSKIGAHANAAQYDTTGGRALKFYSSIRLQLNRIENIKASSADDAEIIGMKVKAYTVKNKVAPPFKQCTLTFLNGHGFSSEYDYFMAGQDAGIVEKSGSWYSFPRVDFRIQGWLPFVYALMDKPEMFKELKSLVDGEDVQPGGPVEDYQPTEEEAAEAA